MDTFDCLNFCLPMAVGECIRKASSTFLVGHEFFEAKYMPSLGLLTTNSGLRNV